MIYISTPRADPVLSFGCAVMQYQESICICGEGPSTEKNFNDAVVVVVSPEAKFKDVLKSLRQIRRELKVIAPIWHLGFSNMFAIWRNES